MPTMTWIRTFDYKVPTEYFGDFANDFNIDAINAAVLNAYDAALPHFMTILGNGDVLAEFDRRDEAAAVDLNTLFEQVDVDAIVQLHELPVA